MYTKYSLGDEPLRILAHGGNFYDTKTPTNFTGNTKTGCRCRSMYYTDENGQRVPDLTQSCYHIINRLLWWMACADWTLDQVLEAAADYDNRGMRRAQLENYSVEKLTGMYAHQTEKVAVERSKASKTRGGTRHPSGRKKSKSAETRRLDDAWKFQPGAWKKLLTHIEENPTHGVNQIRKAMRPDWRHGITDLHLEEAEARGYITSEVVDGRGKLNYTIVMCPTSLAPRYSVALRAAVNALPTPDDVLTVAVDTPDSEDILSDVPNTLWIVIGTVSSTPYWHSQDEEIEGKNLKGLPQSQTQDTHPHFASIAEREKKIRPWDMSDGDARARLEQDYFSSDDELLKAMGLDKELFAM